MDVLIFQVSSFTIYCINALIFHVSSFTICYINALVIKASPLYILKQMPHVSICFRFSSLCLWKKKQSFEQQNLQSVHITVQDFALKAMPTIVRCQTCKSEKLNLKKNPMLVGPQFLKNAQNTMIKTEFFSWLGTILQLQTLGST